MSVSEFQQKKSCQKPVRKYVFICRYEFILIDMNSYVRVGISTKNKYVKNLYRHMNSYVNMNSYVRAGIF